MRYDMFNSGLPKTRLRRTTANLGSINRYDTRRLFLGVERVETDGLDWDRSSVFATR